MVTLQLFNYDLSYFGENCFRVYTIVKQMYAIAKYVTLLHFENFLSEVSHSSSVMKYLVDVVANLIYR